MYAKINGSDIQYTVSLVMPFQTQHGNNAIRVIGMPETNNGFKLYDDNDVLFSDYSDYTYIYSENPYTTEEENIESGECSFDPLSPSPISQLLSEVNKINYQVIKITPYTETKTAYCNEIEKIFYNVPNGNESVFFDNYSGNYSIKRISNRVIISFPNKLTDKTNITIFVQ